MYDEWAGGGFSVKIKNTKCVFVYCLVADCGGGIWPARARNPVDRYPPLQARSPVVTSRRRWLDGVEEVNGI